MPTVITLLPTLRAVCMLLLLLALRPPLTQALEDLHETRTRFTEARLERPATESQSVVSWQRNHRPFNGCAMQSLPC